MVRNVRQEGFTVPGLNLAVVLEAGEFRILSGHGPAAPRPAHPGEVEFILRSGQELRQVPAEDLAHDLLHARVQREAAGKDLLRMLLYGLDPELSAETRVDALDAAEDLLADPDARRFALNRLCGRPMPEEADLAGGMRLARDHGFFTSLGVFGKLETLSGVLAGIDAAWHATIPTRAPGFQADAALRNAVDSGLLYRAAEACVAGGDVGALLFDETIKRRLAEHVPQAAKVIAAFVAAVRRHVETRPRDMTDPVAADRTEPSADPAETASSPGDPILDLIVSAKSAERSARGGQRAPGRRAHEALDKVNKQKDFIQKAFDDGRADLAWKSIRDLAAMQSESGHLAQLSISLSDLAAKRLSTGDFDAALRLYDYAEAANDLDVVPRSDRAEALKAQGRLDEALTAYEANIARHPHDVAARVGRAEVLKALGRLDEALAAYDDTIALDPRNVVARSGRAEVLKAQGWLEAALAAYEETIALDPRSVVARAGRAEVLKAQGRLDAALAAYDDTIAQDPRSVVVRAGRAEVLKAQGRLDNALAAYDDTIALDPRSVVARNGRAEALKAQGRLDEALAAYDDTVAMDPRDLVARAGRAEVLKAQGRLDAALAAYDETIAQYPHHMVARNGRAGVLLALGRAHEVVEEFTKLRSRTFDEWGARHILAMAQLALKDADAAKWILENSLAYCEFADSRPDFQGMRALIDIRERRWDKAEGRLLTLAPLQSLRPPNVILLSHVQAARGKQDQAAQRLEGLPAAAPAQVISLRDALSRRYGLLGRPQAPAREHETLDRQIDDGEFTLVLAALTARRYASVA